MIDGFRECGDFETSSAVRPARIRSWSIRGKGAGALLSYLIKCARQESWKTDSVASSGYRAHGALLQGLGSTLVGARHARDLSCSLLSRFD